MICKYCDTEHPEEHIANPHYCIAELQIKAENLEAKYDCALENNIKNMRQIQKLEAEIITLRSQGVAARTCKWTEREAPKFFGDNMIICDSSCNRGYFVVGREMLPVRRYDYCPFCGGKIER